MITLAYLGETKGGATGQPTTTMVSTLVGSGPSSVPVPVVGPTNPALPPPSPEDIELTPQGIQSLPSLPVTGEVEVSGDLRPEHTWATYKLAVGPTTQSLKVTVSHDPSLPAPANPALDQLYLVGPKGDLLAQLKGASEYSDGPRQAVTISLSGIPQGAQLLVRVVETPIVVPQAPMPAPQSAPAVDLPYTMQVQRTEMHSSSGFSPLGLAVGAVGPLLITYGSSAVSLVPTTFGTATPGDDVQFTGPRAGQGDRSPVGFCPSHGGIRDGGTGRLGRSPGEPGLGADRPDPGDHAGRLDSDDRAERASVRPRLDGLRDRRRRGCPAPRRPGCKP